MLNPNGNYILLTPSSNENHYARPELKCWWKELMDRRIQIIICPNRLNKFLALNYYYSSSTIILALLCFLFIFYLLLPMEFSNESEQMEQDVLSTPHFFKKRIVHLDLKGAAPKPEYLFELFPLLAKLEFNGILMEYEDMLPYSNQLARLARKTAYNEATIKQITQLASSLGLELFPLLQTFGHMEFVLKHGEFSDLRENPVWMDTICPSKERSIQLIREMLSQVRSLHPMAKSIHIGCDEAWHIGVDELCRYRLNTTLHGSLERLKLEHIAKVAKIAREEFNFDHVYAWNDMFDKTNVSLLKEYDLGNLLIPIVWGYARDVTEPGYFPQGLFQRYNQVFGEVLFASAYKGANGISQQFMDIHRYIENLASYKQLYLQNKPFLENQLSGIVLTGWQRYAHTKPLCELLPVGIPTIMMQALFLAEWNGQNPVYRNRIKKFLNCTRQHDSGGVQTHFETEFNECQFPGADLYKEMEAIRALSLRAENQTITMRRTGENEEQIEREYHEMKRKMVPLLSKYFFEDTVNEWMTQYKELSEFQLVNDPSTPRFDPIL